MSIPQSYFAETTVPDGTIDRVLKLENLSGRSVVMPVDVPSSDAYAFSAWVKGGAAGSMTVELFGNTQQVTVSTAWQRVTMVADDRSGDTVRLTPQSDAAYYIYRAMLETGNKPGDWSPSPEDGEASVTEIRQSVIDLSDSQIALSARVETVEDDTDALGTRVGSVEGTITNGVPKVRNSSVLIDPDGIAMESTGTLKFKAGTGESAVTKMELSGNGIDMRTAGKVNIHAQDENGEIVFGTDRASAVFSVGDRGQMYAKSVSADVFQQAGAVLPNIRVSASQPDGHNVLWLKPSSETEKNWSYSPDSFNLNEGTSGSWHYRDYVIPYAAADYLAGSGLFYGITASLYCYDVRNMPKDVTLRAVLRLSNNTEIELGQKTERMRTNGNYVNLDAMTAALQSNVMSIDGGSFTVRLMTNVQSYEARLVLGPFTFKARTNATGGVSACSIFYIQ